MSAKEGSSDFSVVGKAREVEISIVMPAYNEAGRIGPTLREYVERFRHLHSDSFEIIVVLNGCVDDTREVVNIEARMAPEIRVIEFQQPMGKGGAIWEGLAVAQGKIVSFVDADNMVRAPEAEKLIRALDSADIAIANRFSGVEEDGRNQPQLRKLISVASRWWVRNFLGLPYSDTQCGAKAFRTAAWWRIAPNVRERGWAFDLDILAHAHRLKLKVVEVPVRWKHVVEGSKVRPWKDVPLTLWATLSIRRRTRRD
jgi:dolichyl-phosphate beta-glucosyltransferase